MKVAVSFLKSKYNIKETIKKIEETNADFIHIDFMDGKFVENKSITFNEMKKALLNTNKMLDVHLMVNNPSKYINEFATLNTDYITFHYEAVKDVMKVINEIKEVGLRIGLSINPNTKISEVEKYLPYIDQLLVMSVIPGKGGQTFMESTIEKIEELISIREINKFDFIISVDGGINDETVSLVNSDMVVSGSYICMSDNYQERIDRLK